MSGQQSAPDDFIDASVYTAPRVVTNHQGVDGTIGGSFSRRWLPVSGADNAATVAAPSGASGESDRREEQPGGATVGGKRAREPWMEGTPVERLRHDTSGAALFAPVPRVDDHHRAPRFHSRPSSSGGAASIPRVVFDPPAAPTAGARTLLFIMFMPESGAAQILMPTGRGDVLGCEGEQGGSRPSATVLGQAALSALGALVPSLPEVGYVVDELIREPEAGDCQWVDHLFMAARRGRAPLALPPGLCSRPFADLPEGRLRDAAALCLLRARSLYPRIGGDDLQRWLRRPALSRAGARSLREVAGLRDPLEGDYLRREEGLSQALSRMQAADIHLRNGLLAVAPEDPAAEHLKGLAELIRPPNVEEIPFEYRLQGALPSFRDPWLALLPFRTRVAPPVTDPLPTPPPRKSPPPWFAPKSLADLLLPAAFESLQHWLESLRLWLLDLAENGEEGAVKRPTPFILGRSEFVEGARDVYWDLRGAVPKPVADQPIKSHLDLDYLAEYRPGWPDEELFSHLLEGVRFKSHQAFQIVLQAHLFSLAKGLAGVHREFKRLHEKQWYGFFPSLPFAPWMTYPNGSTVRKLEPDRPRRTTDAAAPRDLPTDGDGVRVLPINFQSRHAAEDLERGTIDAYYARWREKLGIPFSHDPHFTPIEGAPVDTDNGESLEVGESDVAADEPSTHTRGQRAAVPTGPKGDVSITRSSDPSPKASRETGAFDVDCTRSAANPKLANPFLMGPKGRDERLRDMCVSDYERWLEARTVSASDFGSALPIGSGLESLRGEDVERSLEALFVRVGRERPIHLICSERCRGRRCHTQGLARLARQLRGGMHAPAWPKEIKVTLPEIMSDLAVLCHIGALAGLPVYQLTSDVKDFFNQLLLHSREVSAVGLITLDVEKMLAHQEDLRRQEPELCFITENVLGFGYVPASNIAQRFAYLLCYIWHVEMQRAARSIVAALRLAYPAIDTWLKQREQLNPPTLPVGLKAKVWRRWYEQSKLWTMSMYTDDSHQGFVGRELTICGARVWWSVTHKLRLTMAIVLKFGIGSSVLTQGIILNSSLGLGIVPSDKRRRAEVDLRRTDEGAIKNSEFVSVRGLLQSILFIAGMRRSAMYGLYECTAYGVAVDPDELLRATPLLLRQVAEWRTRLARRAGAPFLAAVDHFARGRGSGLLTRLESSGFDGAVFVLRSDACLTNPDGDGQPGLGGACGGRFWRLIPRVDVPIAVLEFAAAIGEIIVAARHLPKDCVVILEVDALATADNLSEEAAKSPAMRALHTFLLSLPEYRELAPRLLVAHIFGESNYVADRASRGKFRDIERLCQSLGMAPEQVDPPEVLHEALQLAADSLRTLRLRGRGPPPVVMPAYLDFGHLPPPTSPAPAAVESAPPTMPPPVILDLPPLSPWGGAAVPDVLSLDLTTSLKRQCLPAVRLPDPPQLAAPGAPTTSMPQLSSLRDRGAQVFAMLRDDPSPFALRPVGDGLEKLCECVYDPTDATPDNTRRGQRSAWKHWQAWCDLNNTPAWRLGAYDPMDPVSVAREETLQAGFLPFVHIRQSARGSRAGKRAQPNSAIKCLGHVRKMHKDRGCPLPNSTLVTVQLRKLNFKYKEDFGVAGLIPHRKQPFTRQMITEYILGAPGGITVGGLTLDWHALSGRSLRALTCVAACTGFRKSEYTVRRRGPATADCLTFGNVTWLINGITYEIPPPDVLRGAKEGDFLVIQPPPSKSDPFDVIWGDKPIWIPFQRGQALSAFSAVADLFLYSAPSVEDRWKVALFRADDGLPFVAGGLDRLLHDLLCRHLSPAVAGLYSWHSMRIFLATAMLAAGCSRAQIQAVCRWQTEESLNIYAILGADHYRDILDRVMGVDFTAARATNLASDLPFLSIEDLLRSRVAAASMVNDLAAAAVNLNDDPDPDDDPDDDE